MEEKRLPPAETAWIRQCALQSGFTACGTAPAEHFPELRRYPEWIERGYAGKMEYLKDPRRFDPRSSGPDVRSLIVCALNYNVDLPYSNAAGAPPGGEPSGWISRYAWGDDYHEVIGEKLNRVIAQMREHFAGAFEARAYTDTGPIHERLVAKYAGLGWIGKHTLLIDQQCGSWLFLGVILTSLPLTPTLGNADTPPADRCGTCRKCIEACPTAAPRRRLSNPMCLTRAAASLT